MEGILEKQKNMLWPVSGLGTCSSGLWVQLFSSCPESGDVNISCANLGMIRKLLRFINLFLWLIKVE